jgi:hypothetical protein
VKGWQFCGTRKGKMLFFHFSLSSIFEWHEGTLGVIPKEQLIMSSNIQMRRLHEAS